MAKRYSIWATILFAGVSCATGWAEGNIRAGAKVKRGVAWWGGEVVEGSEGEGEAMGEAMRA